MSRLTNKPFVEGNSLKQQRFIFLRLLLKSQPAPCERVRPCAQPSGTCTQQLFTWLVPEASRHGPRQHAHSSGVTHTLLRSARFWQRVRREPWDIQIDGPCSLTGGGLQISPGANKHREQRLWLHRGDGGYEYGSFSSKRTDGRGLLTGVLTLSLT